jgi:RNA polymerase sigma-70 factor, ECF subfamily
MTGPDHESDAELVRRVTEGDRAAFTLLYGRYRQPLFSYCRSLLRDPGRAEDVVHDTFVRIFKHGNALVNSGSARSWIFRIAHNEALMLLRRQREVAEPETDSVWETATPQSILEQEEETSLVRHLIGRLKKEYREVLQLREYEQLSYAEIAGITGDTESSVKSRIYKARRALAQAMTPWYRERQAS